MLGPAVLGICWLVSSSREPGGWVLCTSRPADDDHEAWTGYGQLRMNESFALRDHQLVLPTSYHHQAAHASGLEWKQEELGCSQSWGAGALEASPGSRLAEHLVLVELAAYFLHTHQHVSGEAVQVAWTPKHRPLGIYQ